jgi:hypothetical protein
MAPVTRKGSIVTVATMALGRRWRNMMCGSTRPARGRADVFEVAAPQELGPHHAHERRPAEQDGEPDQEPEAAPEDREDDDDDVKRRGP